MFSVHLFVSQAFGDQCACAKFNPFRKAVHIKFGDVHINSGFLKLNNDDG